MKLQLLLAVSVAVFMGAPVLAADNPAPSPELQKLDVSAGHWIYHGETLATSFGKAGKWTWNEYCRWSESREFMLCDFINDWAGRTVKSLVVDTWNAKDKSFWHYELFPDSGTRPFMSKMTINGNTRVENAESVQHGKKYRTRITYVFDSATHVKVKLEMSAAGAPWVTVDEGEGTKQG